MFATRGLTGALSAKAFLPVKKIHGDDNARLIECRDPMESDLRRWFRYLSFFSSLEIHRYTRWRRCYPWKQLSAATCLPRRVFKFIPSSTDLSFHHCAPRSFQCITAIIFLSLGDGKKEERRIKLLETIKATVFVRVDRKNGGKIVARRGFEICRRREAYRYRDAWYSSQECRGSRVVGLWKWMRFSA